jgi:hypothetical protein
MFTLPQLPEQFKRGPKSQALTAYIARKYSTYGYAKRRAIVYNPEWSPSYTRGRYRWIENVSKGLRKVGDSGEIVRMDHKGWFIDQFQDESVHGEVYQLPARDGVPQFVPAVNDPFNNDSACLDFSSVTNDKEAAARWADDMARMWAEDERAYQAKEEADARMADIAEEIKSAYQEFRDTARALRADCDKIKGIAVVRKLVRKEWARTKATIHKLRAERSRIERYGLEH